MTDYRQCQCECGAVSYRVPKQPLFRMLCHCAICQRFNAAPHADVLVFRARDVDAPDSTTVDFNSYRPPPNVQRGRCRSCGQAAVETFAFPLMPSLVMAPVGMAADPGSLPAPVCHVFYEGRREDADDDLPRYRGYLWSQLAFFRYLYFPGRS